jgi:hypothetical protein
MKTGKGNYLIIDLPLVPSHISQRKFKFVETPVITCNSYQTTGSHISSRSIIQPLPKQVTVKTTYDHRFYN